MARNGVTREQVVDAAARLQAQGRAVTVTAVRELLGGTGSYTTISAHLKGWRQSGEAAPMPKELERSFVHLLGRLWRALLLGLGAEVRRTAEGRMHELELAARGCEEDVRRLEAEQSSCRQQLAALQAELARNERLVAAVESEMATLHREQRRLREEEQALARRLDGKEGPSRD